MSARIFRFCSIQNINNLLHRFQLLLFANGYNDTSIFYSVGHQFALNLIRFRYRLLVIVELRLASK